MPFPPDVLAAASDPMGGKWVLVIGAGCSVEPPTSLQTAAVCAREAHRRLRSDGLLSQDCDNPDDLSVVADAVFAETGGQQELVAKLPLARFRSASPNQGHYFAAALLTGISVLPAPDGPLYTRRAAERTKLLSSHIRPAPEAVTSARADVRPTGAPAFRAFLRHRSTRVPFLRQAGFVALSPRVSLPAPVAPRSSAASRRTAAGSDALPPAGASSTAHASPAAPRSSPAAAGDS